MTNNNRCILGWSILAFSFTGLYFGLGFIVGFKPVTCAFIFAFSFTGLMVWAVNLIESCDKKEVDVDEQKIESG